MKNHTLKITICIIVLLFNIKGVSQEGVSINNTPSPPDPSAMLDVQSLNKGMLIPRVSIFSPTSALISGVTPATGLLVYNTNTTTQLSTGFYFWKNGMWNNILGLWDIDPAATPTVVGGIFRKGVVTIGQSTVATPTTTTAVPLTSTLQVFGPAIFYSQGIPPASGNYGIHIGEANNQSGAYGHANEINCYNETMDMQWNTGQSIRMGAIGGSNLTVAAASTHPADTTYGCIIADHHITAKGWLRSTYGVVTTSDSTLKKNIVQCTDVLSKIVKLNTYYYHYKDENDGDQKHIGVLAQQVERQFKHLVRGVSTTTQDFSTIPSTGKNFLSTTTKSVKGMDYQALTALLLQAIKEQQLLIEDLKTRVLTLEQK